MKIRTDFVTNSSSSSFVSINAENEVLAEILKKYKESLDEECCCNVSIDGSEIRVHIEEAYADVPTSQKEVFASLLSAFGCEDYEDDNCECEGCNCDGSCDCHCSDNPEGCCCECHEKEDEDNEYYGNNPELIKELKTNRKAIINAMKRIEFTTGDVGWQGDSESRYEMSNYDEETLNMYFAEIAAENGCEIDEVTEDDFCEFVSDKMSIEETTYKYDAETGEESTSHSFVVE